MNEIPSWVVVWAGVFFIVQTVFTLCLIGAVIFLIIEIKKITPKVAAIGDKVNDIGEKVDDLTANVKTTVEALSGRAKSVAGSADLIAQTASRTFERFSPAVVGILSALRILKAIQEFRRGAHAGDSSKPKSLGEQGSSESAKVDKRGKK